MLGEAGGCRTEAGESSGEWGKDRENSFVIHKQVVLIEAVKCIM